MNKRISFFLQSWLCCGLFINFVFSLSSQAQSIPVKQWDKTFGGRNLENLGMIQQTSDGGYILGGYSSSGISGDKTQANIGSMDYWIVKLDSSGKKTWDKVFGGSIYEELNSLQQTFDGGYILGGYSSSPISGDKSEACKGTNDYWVIKLDANGNRIWDKTLGGSDYEFFSSVQQTSDGGYILGGSSKSGISGDKSQTSKGGYDYWVVKLDVNGNKTWDKTLGGSEDDYLHALKQTTDGSYILGGESLSGISNDKSQISKGKGDFWLIMLDASGNKSWDKTFGGNDRDYISSLQQTTDNGFILGGWSSSGTGIDKNQGSKGLSDYWIVKLDANGNRAWDKTFGGSDNDLLSSLQQTSDEGYILGGYSFSPASGDKSQANNGICDYWIVKLDENGSKIWDKNLGGGNHDALVSIQQTSDGGYILGGESQSGVSGDKSQASKGGTDYWVVKLSMPLSPVFPNIITLNNDGRNDTFKPQSLTEGQWQIQIYNRWGIQIFESENYQNNWPDKKIADGTYYYFLKNSETGQQFKGWVEVVQ